MACDCKVIVKPTGEPDVPWGQIEYCSMHLAAGQMLEALKGAKRAYDSLDRNMPHLITALEIRKWPHDWLTGVLRNLSHSLSAIAAAEPKKE